MGIGRLLTPTTIEKGVEGNDCYCYEIIDQQMGAPRSTE